ncbi:hypothetical protein A3D06_00835 [Candidatus Roizmanbacteria bacterium RIFCSPHIGHO2_02_FULL_40_9]|uniref:Cupin type-2 domain-containing protein n=2 Tax=Candidatus Roizmaniibacteriota TaxID=1752723 RepID=A0A1F7IM06_9BACT|nr:MAG: hypothetical protein A3D06_00835 [Candidatus Roizmanbacteria bacterium RIFCSPHIGHO2_02_FULL_40_9]OGK44388.1 MAG: hypothetical protein A2957_00815 [Candidatus Roizmanbacteria bacterium RIFCSPLOWO2_01_FULL_38_11]
MFIKKSQSTPIKTDNDSTIWDYPMPSEEQGISYQELNGRLPKKGWYKNIKCHEIFFIISGSATVTIEDETQDANEGDMVIIEPGQKHYGIYQQTKLITITTPNWYDEQCEIIGV